MSYDNVELYSGFFIYCVALLCLCLLVTQKDESEKILQVNTVYTLPDGNKIKIIQEGKNSVIMPANEIVKEK